MKVRFIFSLIAILFMAGVSQANEISLEMAYSGKRVVLEGEVGTETSRSGTIDPIEATISEDYVMNVIFVKPIGEVQIVVNGEVIETRQVNTAGQETAFSVADLAPGTYKLEFKTSGGGYLYGEFVIE